MDLTDAEIMELLSELKPAGVALALREICEEMLNRGEDPDEVAELFQRICAKLGIDPATLRRGMN